eukprot:gene20144-28509_t
MWPGDKIGQVHTVTSNQGYWHCTNKPRKCQLRNPITFTLQVVSTQPRVFIIENFLNNFEAEKIIEIARPQIEDSIVGTHDGGGARKSSTRTSLNAWVGRDVNQ